MTIKFLGANSNTLTLAQWSVSGIYPSKIRENASGKQIVHNRYWAQNVRNIIV